MKKLLSTLGNGNNHTDSRPSTPREQLLGVPINAPNRRDTKSSSLAVPTSSSSTSSNSITSPNTASSSGVCSAFLSTSPSSASTTSPSSGFSPNIYQSSQQGSGLQSQIQNLQHSAKSEILQQKQIQNAKIYKYQFEDIYDNYDTRILFKKFLKQNQNEENYYFDVMLDREYRPLKSNRNRWMIAKRIMSTFINSGAPMELNLSEKMKHTLSKEFEKATEDNCPVDLFDSVQYQVLSSMRMDAFPRFLQSNDFLQYVGGRILSTQKHIINRVRFLKSIGAVRKQSPLEQTSSRGNLRKSLNVKRSKKEEEEYKETMAMQHIDAEDNMPENLVFKQDEMDILLNNQLYNPSENDANTTDFPNPVSPRLAHGNSPPVVTPTSEISHTGGIKRSMSNIMGHLLPFVHGNQTASPSSNTATGHSKTGSSVEPYVHVTRHQRAGSTSNLSMSDLMALSKGGASIGVKLHDSLPRAIAPINNFIVTPCSDDERDDDELDEDDLGETNMDDETHTEHERINNFDKIISKSTIFANGTNSSTAYKHEGVDLDDNEEWAQNVDTYMSSESDDEDEEELPDEDVNVFDIAGNLATTARRNNLDNSTNCVVIPLIEILSPALDQLQLSIKEVNTIRKEYQTYVNNISSLDLNSIIADDEKKDQQGWHMMRLNKKKRRMSALSNRDRITNEITTKHSLKAHRAKYISQTNNDQMTFMLRRSCKLPYDAFSVLQVLCDEGNDNTIVNPLLLSPAEFIEYVVKDTENSYASLISLEGAKWPWPLKHRHYITTGTVVSDDLSEDKSDNGRKRYIIMKRSVVNNSKLEITINKKDNPNRLFGEKLEAYVIESYHTNECNLIMFNEWRFNNSNKWMFPTKLFNKSLKEFSIKFHENLIDRLSSFTGSQLSYHDLLLKKTNEDDINIKKDSTLIHTLFRNEALGVFKQKEEIKTKVQHVLNTLSLMKMFEFDLQETCRILDERHQYTLRMSDVHQKDSEKVVGNFTLHAQAFTSTEA